MPVSVEEILNDYHRAKRELTEERWQAIQERNNYDPNGE